MKWEKGISECVEGVCKKRMCEGKWTCVVGEECVGREWSERRGQDDTNSG